MLNLQVITILKHNKRAPKHRIAKDLQSKAIPSTIHIVLQRAITIRVVHGRIGKYVGRYLKQKVAHRHAEFRQLGVTRVAIAAARLALVIIATRNASVEGLRHVFVDNKQTGSRVGDGDVRVQVVLQLTADSEDWRDKGPIALLRHDWKEV